MNWYLKCLRQYADFSGRARRMEYWMFILFNIIFGWIAIILDNMLEITVVGICESCEMGYGPLYGLYVLVLFIPNLAVAVRRLHDVGKSGWMLLVSLIPVIGFIWLLVLFLTDSDPGENKYGSNPKGVSV